LSQGAEYKASWKLATTTEVHVSETSASRLHFIEITTPVSLLRQAVHGQSADAGAARNALALRYRRAIRSYLGAILQDEHDADEVAQEVVVKLLQGKFAGVDLQKGRFRDYLKTVVRNAATDYGRKKKRTVLLEMEQAAAPDERAAPEEDRWTAEWRADLLRRTWEKLEAHQRQHEGSLVFTVLQLAADHPDDSSEQLAQRLAEAVGRPFRADAVRKQISRARQRFSQLLVQEIADSLEDPRPELVDEEVCNLGLGALLDQYVSASE
jgi:RNA polymerase sigma-70 factor (ECF subfamily)